MSFRLLVFIQVLYVASNHHCIHRIFICKYTVTFCAARNYFLPLLAREDLTCCSIDLLLILKLHVNGQFDRKQPRLGRGEKPARCNIISLQLMSEW